MRKRNVVVALFAAFLQVTAATTVPMVTMAIGVGCGPSNPEMYGFNKCQGPAWCNACTSYCKTQYTEGYNDGLAQMSEGAKVTDATTRSCYGFVCDINDQDENYGCYEGRSDGEYHGQAAARQCYEDGYYDALSRRPRDPELEKARVCIYQGTTCPGA